MQSATYHVNEIFYSLQGEGHRTGMASLFVRFAGCNMRCDLEPGPLSPGGFACDSEFVSSVAYAEDALVEEIHRRCPPAAQVVFTGGEPLRQLTTSLLQKVGRECAVETNGSLPLPEGATKLWVTCSPKVAEHAIRLNRVDELKYVRGAGQGIPRPRLHAAYKYLSPAFDGMNPDREAIATCLKLVKENPEWRLTLQTHKLLLIR